MYSSQTFPLSSIKTALGKVTHDCRVAKSNGLVSVLISLDFSAAYGSVGHSLLLKTLHLASRKAHTAGFPLTTVVISCQSSLLFLPHFPNILMLDYPRSQSLASSWAIQTSLVITSILKVLNSISMLIPYFAMLVQLVLGIYHSCVCACVCMCIHIHTRMTEIFLPPAHLQLSMSKFNSYYPKLSFPHSSLNCSFHHSSCSEQNLWAPAFSHTTHNMSENPPCSTFKIYTDSYYFTQLTSIPH